MPVMSNLRTSFYFSIFSILCAVLLTVLAGTSLASSSVADKMIENSPVTQQLMSTLGCEKMDCTGKSTSQCPECSMTTRCTPQLNSAILSEDFSADIMLLSCASTAIPQFNYRSILLDRPSKPPKSIV